MTRYGCPCVTLAGNVHERGRLQGGYRGEQTSAFRSLLSRQRTRDASGELRACATLAKSHVAAAQRSASLARAAHDAAREEEVARQRRESLRLSVEAQRADMRDAQLALAADAQKRENLAARMQRLRQEATLLRRPEAFDDSCDAIESAGQPSARKTVVGQAKLSETSGEIASEIASGRARALEKLRRQVPDVAMPPIQLPCDAY